MCVPAAACGILQCVSNADDHASFGVLTQTFHPDLVEAVAAQGGALQQRRRELPARLTLYLVLAVVVAQPVLQRSLAQAGRRLRVQRPGPDLSRAGLGRAPGLQHQPGPRVPGHPALGPALQPDCRTPGRCADPGGVLGAATT